MTDHLDSCNCKDYDEEAIFSLKKEACGRPTARFFVWPRSAGDRGRVVFGRCAIHSQHVDCAEVTRSEAVTIEVMES